MIPDSKSEPNHQGLGLFCTLDDNLLFSMLSVDPHRGLTSAEVALRLKQYGPNLPIHLRKASEWKELLKHFKSPLLIILMFASSLSFFLGETMSGGIIAGAVLLSVFIDYFLERDARNAADALRKTVQPCARVYRDGMESEITTDQLCPGDIILLSAGSMVSADARIFEGNQLFVNQSFLTGESIPINKHAGAIHCDESDISSMDNILFMGSSIQSGTAKAVVVRTGALTEFGKVGRQLQEGQSTSDFTKGMKQFGVLVMKITVILVVFIFAVNAVLRHDLLESFLFSLAVAVGITPEMLPMVMSVTMSRGSLRMAKKGAVVKKVMAIPNFGSMDVLCTDKTGTITQDRIEMVKCVDASGMDSDEVLSYAYLNAYLQSGMPNPLDDAVIRYATHKVLGYEKIGEVPFDFTRKRMSVIVRREGIVTLICKGAPEEVMAVAKDDPASLAHAQAIYASLSMDGFRVLCIAVGHPLDKSEYGREDEVMLDLKGFIAFLDPPKQDAAEVIKELQGIGVEVKIITGDNSLVTHKVCTEIGLKVKGTILGQELEKMSDDELAIKSAVTTVFARCSPEQKKRVILALRSVHHAVGYLGDGINDAPSLRAADVGISVSSASDVARDAADIILTRKDLLILRDGILEGRKTFANTMKYIYMDLSSNFGNMFSVAAATLFLPFLPMLPVQILINNFLYDSSQIAIPLDNVDDKYVQKPRRWNMRMIRNYMILFGLTSSVFDMATFWLLYRAFPVTTAQFRTGWFMESLATQILVIFIIRTSVVPFWKSKPGKYLTWSALAFLAFGWTLPYMPFASKIGFQPISSKIVVLIVVLLALYLFVAEVLKKLVLKRIMPDAWE